MEFEKCLPLVEAIFKDLKAFKLRIKTKVFKISECNQIRQGINHMRTDYDHWLAILGGIRNKLNAELDVWERALAMIDTMLEENKLKVEISDGGCELYIKLTRELKDTLFVNVDLKEGLENVPLTKAKVWIEKKIVAINNSLKTMEQDREYIEEQKAHIFMLEKCMEEKLKTIRQLDKKPEPIEQKLDNNSEYKIIENVEVDSKNITKIKSTISHQDSSMKSYGKDGEIIDLPEEINYLLVKFPNANQTEYSESRGNQGVEKNLCVDKLILQDCEPEETQTVDKYPCEDEAILRDHNSIEEKVINNSEVNDLQKETNELLVEFPNSNKTENREQKENQEMEVNLCEDLPTLQDREPKETQTVDKYPCEDNAIFRDHKSIKEKVINNSENNNFQEEKIKLLVEFPNSNKSENREPTGNQGVEMNLCEEESMLRDHEPKGNQSVENPYEDKPEVVYRDSSETYNDITDISRQVREDFLKITNEYRKPKGNLCEDEPMLQDREPKETQTVDKYPCEDNAILRDHNSNFQEEKIKLLVEFPNSNKTENREPYAHQELKMDLCEDEPIWQDREPESNSNQGIENPRQGNPKLEHIIKMNEINNMTLNNLQREIRNIFHDFPNYKPTEYCEDEPILQDREPESRGNQGVENPCADNSEYWHIIKMNEINRINDFRRDIRDIFLRFQNKTTECGEFKGNQGVDKNPFEDEPILQDREPESKDNQGVYNPCEDKPKLGYGYVIENKTVNYSKINDLRTEIKDLLAKFPRMKKTEYSAPQENLEENNSCEKKTCGRTFPNSVKAENSDHNGKQEGFLNSNVVNVNVYRETLYETHNETINETINETLNTTGNETVYYDAKECQDTDSVEDTDIMQAISLFKNVHIS